MRTYSIAQRTLLNALMERKFKRQGYRYVCMYIYTYIYIFFFSPISGVINNPPANEGDTGLIPGLGQEDPLEWQLASVFLPGKFHGQRSLVGYSP